MASDGGSNHIASLRDYLRVLRRRKLALLLPLVVAPAAAVGLAFTQPKLYEASAEVLLSRQNLATSLTGTTDPTVYQQAERIAQTQAELARVPEIAVRTLRVEGVSDRTARDFLAGSSVSAKRNSDLLEFRVEDRSPQLAMALATEYANQFSIYRRELDTASLRRASEEVRARIQELQAAGEGRSALFSALVEKEQQLRTMEALQTSNALVVRSADDAVQVQPRPIFFGLIGLALGVMLGIGLAFLWEALDTRVRSAEEISERLGLPLLARLQAPPRKLRKRNKLVMLEDPNGAHAESFRMLRTNLDFVNLERGAQAIMVTSAVPAEGKSTTVSNLAVALARAGKHVILVDLDVRRPRLDRIFPAEARPGITEVALGYARLRYALLPIPVHGRDVSNGSDEAGSLEVITAGPVPPDGGEFIGSRALGEILDELRDQCDVLLVDAPPLLQVGDGLALSARVDGLILVCRLNVIRRPMLRELKRILGSLPTEKLGFVLTGADLDDSYTYDFGEYTESYDWAVREVLR